MKKSLVREAALAFSKGDFTSALNLFEKIGDLIGRHNFKANIHLCERRIWESKRAKDYSQSPLKKIKVACVMDDFTFHSYDPECNLLQLTPDCVIDELENFQPDLLFIESAWRGKDELWNRKIGTLSKELKSTLQWCNKNYVPTVFWNKEDPVHFETFLTTAQKFDCVFTTDIDCIGRYKAALGHDRVFLLPFACQPKLHNPIELYQRKDAFCFAGAYYVRYPERTRDLETYVKEFPKFKPLEIYDRNFGKNDVNYQFPVEYQPHIVGTLPFHEIDKAYKGYRYAINLNSIKQSQTMFARRVYELLGSNTITVSNFSRGVRLMFGDLVVASDNGKQIVDRLQQMDEESSQKLRLAALRKVMLEHTYQRRLSYVCEKALGWKGDNNLPEILVIAFAANKEELSWAIENYRRQQYDGKRLLIGISTEIRASSIEPIIDSKIETIPAEQLKNKKLGDLIKNSHWISVMAAEDYYGANFLIDLALATRYSSKEIIGKGARYKITHEGIFMTSQGMVYQENAPLAIRSSIISATTLNPEQEFGVWHEQFSHEPPKGLAIDPFNYCESGNTYKDKSTLKTKVDDLKLNSGLSIDELLKNAEAIPPEDSYNTELPKWGAQELNNFLGEVTHKLVRFESRPDGFVINSSLLEGRHEYFYSKNDCPISSLPKNNVLDSFLDVTPGLNLEYVFVFLNEKKQKLSHAIHRGSRNHSAAIPDGTAFVRIGWRICGAGVATVRFLMLCHRKIEPPVILGISDTLLLTNHYPSYQDLYRNGFVHSRVRAYRKRGILLDVFRLQPDQPLSSHEFENVDVVTGDPDALRKTLDSGRYRTVLIHFLSPKMWEILAHYPKIRKIVWIHGAEIHPWHRREYNYQTEQELTNAKVESEKRMAFWRKILNPMTKNLELVFVSRHFAEEVMEDLGFRLSEENYKIIHNPIDTNLFSYVPKAVDQRKKVLSIRPYASRTYANDLSVQAILKLANRPFFKEMEFRMIGDGILFDETLEPLRKFPNVIIERRFLSQPEIATLHKQYGLFLVPTRMDTQGVSRDEAMSSGLVPLTNSVAAIPEFVDERCGVLAGADDAAGLAAGIEAIFNDPERFALLSRNAAHRVREQSAGTKIISQEITIFSTSQERQN